ncbi:MAG: D-alanyl-D-alanine carboxypeptidase [Lachnospiraceae bacterium]|nr:D-alanyl-D-alanine carboxypeptidase [Lachnospiraceae bacterium]
MARKRAGRISSPGSRVLRTWQLFFVCLALSAAAVLSVPKLSLPVCASPGFREGDNDTSQIPGWPQGPEISAPAAILIDADSGTVLYGKNIHEQHYPASTTKLLTTLLAYERMDMTHSVSFSPEAVYSVPADGSSVGMDVGEMLTVEQAMFAVMSASANECANALGEAMGGGSIEAFADIMNERARQLGCEDTHFVNPSGLFDENHYTTPYDLALIAREYFSIDLLCSMANTRRYHIPPTISQPDDIWINNRNMLINGEMPVEGLVGSKTGYTDVARASLVTCAERDGMRVICVVMQEESPLQYEDTVTLINYAFQYFHRLTFSVNEETVALTTPDYLKNGNTILGAPADTLEVVGGGSAVLPVEVPAEDLTRSVSFLDEAADEGHSGVDAAGEEDARTIARIDYAYYGLPVATAYLRAIPSGDVPKDLSGVRAIYGSEDSSAVSGSTRFSRYVEKTDSTLYVFLPVLLRDICLAAGAAAAVIILIAYLLSFNIADSLFTKRFKWRISRRRGRR